MNIEDTHWACIPLDLTYICGMLYFKGKVYEMSQWSLFAYEDNALHIKESDGEQHVYGLVDLANNKVRGLPVIGETSISGFIRTII